MLLILLLILASPLPQIIASAKSIPSIHEILSHEVFSRPNLSSFTQILIYFPSNPEENVVYIIKYHNELSHTTID